MLVLFKHRLLVSAGLLIWWIMLIGCTGDQDATYVDFSDRMDVERPGAGNQGNPYFKVAVGSIISAQETVVHYHELFGIYRPKIRARNSTRAAKNL